MLKHLTQVFKVFCSVFLCCCLLLGLCLNANAVTLDEIASNWTTKGYTFEENENQITFSDGQPPSAVSAENVPSLIASSGSLTSVTANNTYNAKDSVLSDSWIDKDSILNGILQEHYNKTGKNLDATVNDLFILSVSVSYSSPATVYYFATLKTKKYGFTVEFSNGAISLTALSGSPVVGWCINSSNNSYGSVLGVYGMNASFGTYYATGDKSMGNLTGNNISGEYSYIGYGKEFYYREYNITWGTTANICSNTSLSESRNNLFGLKGLSSWGVAPYPTAENYSEQMEEERHNGLLGAISSLGDKIGGFFTTLKDGLINGIKSLFVPSGDFWSSFKTDMDKFLTAHLGFIWQSISFFPRVISALIEYFTDYSDVKIIQFPEMSFTLNGEDVVLSKRVYFDFDNLLDTSDTISTFYDMYKVFLNGLLLYFVYRLALRKYQEFTSK